MGRSKVHRLLSLWVFGDVIYAVLPLPPGDEDFSHRWRAIKPMVTQRCPNETQVIRMDESAPLKAEPEHVMAASILGTSHPR
jgi:hypothetical protein